jgi:MSHA biogenesis protein MshO
MKMQTAHTHAKIKGKAMQGFTLIELVMVIVIMGVISSTLVYLVRGPVDAYFNNVRRAAIVDSADTAMRRMSRDIRSALPNTVVVASTAAGGLNGNNGIADCVTLIPTKTGGRYRADGSASALTFGTPITSFNMLGANPSDPNQTISAGDVVVVGNYGITGANAYALDNTAVLTSVAAATVANGAGPETTLGFSSGKTFDMALGSPNSRFQVVPAGQRVVSYVCTAAGTLVRNSFNTAVAAANSCLTTGSILSTKVNQCSFVYDVLAQNDALVRLTLGINDNGETLRLLHQVHIDTTP